MNTQKVYEQEHYTEGSYRALQNAISQAEKVVLNPNTQDEVMEMTTVLQRAIDGLERIIRPEPDPEVDTSELSKLIEHAKIYEQENYTEGSYAALQNAISQAEKIVRNPKTQEEVGEAIVLLQKTINGLEKIAESDPEAEVDTGELSKLINHAKTYEKDKYTETSYGALQQAISHAEAVVQTANTQNEVTEAITHLQKAINGLEKIAEPEPDTKVDTGELSKLISHAKTYEKDKYTETSYGALQQAISHAEAVVQNASTQDEVTEATSLLQKAIAGLEEVTKPAPEPEVDTGELSKLIEHAKTYEKDKYTEASFGALQQAINHAEAVVQNVSTQSEVTEAITLLQKAMVGLERVTDPKPDPEHEMNTTELSKLIEHAKTYEQETYTETSYAHLQQAISQAEAVVQNAKTQDEVTDAVTQLQQAIVGLEKIVEPTPNSEVDMTELEKLIAKAKAYPKENYTAASYGVLQKAVSQAETVVEKASTQEEVIEAINLLQEAIEGLERVPDTKPDPAPVTPEVDTTELEKLIAQAKTYGKEDYTDTSYAVLQKAIRQAETVLEDEKTEETIAEATIQLRKAIAGLGKIEISKPDPTPVPEVDTTELEKLIVQAKKYNKETYTAGSYTALQKAISQAEAVLENAETAEEVRTSITQLQKAIEGLDLNDSESELAEKQPTQLPGQLYDYEVDGENDKSTHTGQLPNTATQNYNWFILGLLLVSVGSLILIRRRKA
ncbi:LPXTG-motif cell wall-anchored protein [Lederbergia galactosidilyticus]|uniref:LPXTG cell wall anchor domain-containing protein n=1 Tax=Lederbergia galactosidilytica TaxID=217031 RepID=UPI001AE19AC6|nr:LPXTG cell wall anchor domain-containing protein [Lederbergia galactosidilytica]MBP1915127.1 LPXTG-motif cell wall-anchored protein [Lederbergia galactosidilytica]